MSRTQSANAGGENAEPGGPAGSSGGVRRAEQGKRRRPIGEAAARRWLTHISPLGMLLAAVLFIAADIADRLTGGDTFLTSGPLDETAHLLTALIVLWAIGGVLWDRLLVGALIASVAIDLDHLPGQLGYDWFTAGTPRPYTHSLLTVALVLAIAWRWRSRRLVVLAVALGLILHLWRDTAEPGSGVALLWPFTDHSFSTSHSAYLTLMGVAFAVGMWCSLRWQSRSRAPGRHRAGPGPRAGRGLVPEGPGA